MLREECLEWTSDQLQAGELSLIEVTPAEKEAAKLFRAAAEAERAAAVIHKGIEQCKAIIKEGDTMKNLQKYTDTVSECVFAYVISKDERFLDTFSSLYMTLFNAR